MKHRAAARGATVVLDIGKTSVKWTLIDPERTVLADERMPNVTLHTGPYPHHDIDGIWSSTLAVLRRFAGLARVGAIVPVTHGATAALVDAGGPVLPVLDYESALPEQASAFYDAMRPPFARTFSPALPAGLNLGRQLAWQAQRFPAVFGRARHILPYPQYWAWRLCGVAAAEVTSLGCHTDLWEPVAGAYSTLVERMGWRRRFPPMQRAWTPLGPLLPDIAAATGLPADCQVLCGIHDSNASLLRHLGAGTGTVLSTGTWIIAAAFGAPLDRLDEQADMLANVDALGRPVACMRFMGGRAFDALGGAAPEGHPLASDYCAHMTATCLETLDATGPITIEGSFTANPRFAATLAALRPNQPVTVSLDANGTTHGAWLLHHWHDQNLL